MPTHCYFETVRGLPEPSMVSLEQIKTIDKCRIEKYLGKMTREQTIIKLLDQWQRKRERQQER